MPPRRLPDTPLMLRFTLPSPPPRSCVLLPTTRQSVRTVHCKPGALWAVQLGSVLLLVLLLLPWGQGAVAPRYDCRAEPPDPPCRPRPGRASLGDSCGRGRPGGGEEPEAH
ncbi:hypothetical protein NDU88_001099 [Pleurodeles waltl]|uniref:Uncharacterized protein n=1 Tax=Pleurodeles waltl TaxID=8319 RepID=A0AAV7SZH8_PLEWA|nr:hypothetical protein NDU88_001099 [Pleurodeles waltl]